MFVNVCKTKYINLAYSSFNFDFPIKFHSFYFNVNTVCNCQYIDNNYFFKYLGSTLDEKLNWESHVFYLHNKLKSIVRTFYNLKNFSTTDLLKLLYFVLAGSRKQYVLQCWGGIY